MIKPGYLCFALFALIASCLHAQQAPVASPGTVSLAEIRIRDPFILPDSAQRIYYLFGTNYPDAAPGKGGFDVYTSRDLISWQGPEAVYRPASGIWGWKNFWAPECHTYRGKSYLFVTMWEEAASQRGTTILRAERPAGPYREYAKGRVTPEEWGALDGTLYLDGQGDPWMVFCHEWVQVGDGTIEAVPLRKNLRGPAGKPVTLFAASEAPWVRAYAPGKYVTDGPFLYRNSRGELLMLWSSFGQEGYALGVARSLSGEVTGPWEHVSEPLFARDGGHGMLFRTFDGQLVLSLHQPNKGPLERTRLFLVGERPDGLPYVVGRLTEEAVPTACDDS